jgi:ribosome-binding factor A
VAHRPFAPSKGPSHRPARLAQRIKEELSLMVPSELSDPRVEGASVIITEVAVTPDMKNANVKFALEGGDEKRAKTITACLNDAANFLRGELRSKLELRFTPILAFKYDKGYSNVNSIERLLHEAREKDAAAQLARDSKEEE